MVLSFAKFPLSTTRKEESVNMKKIIFYNFLSSKEEELASADNNEPQQKVSKVVVEMRDDGPLPTLDRLNPWQIKKNLTIFEVANKRLVISSVDAFNHIFRYFDLEMANKVVSGNKYLLLVRDVTGQSYPKTYYGSDFYMEMLTDGNYTIACKDIFQDHQLSIGDEIGLFVDPWHLIIVFKVLSKTMY